MKQLKLISVLILVGLLVVFVVQNAEVLKVVFLIWTFEIRRALLIFVALVIGILIGWLLRVEHMRGRYMAIYGMSWGIPIAFAPLLAGVIMDYYDPRWVWWGVGIIGLVAVFGFWDLNTGSSWDFEVIISVLI